MTPLAAVIVNFRTPHATAAAVHSVGSSARAPQQVIVVENGSGDDSAGQLRALCPAAHLIVLRENRGFAAGANAGIREALGRGAELVLLVNSDAVLEPGAIAKLEAALAHHPRAGIAGPSVLQPGLPPRLESSALRFSPRSGRVRMAGFGEPFAPVGAVQTVQAITGCVMLIRARVFAAVGLLPEDYFWGFEDLDFCLAAAGAGFETISVPQAVAWHEGSLSIGKASPARIEWATRNHLLLLHRRAPVPQPLGALRGMLVVGWNAAYAVRSHGTARIAGLRAVLRGLRSFLQVDRRS